MKKYVIFAAVSAALAMSFSAYAAEQAETAQQTEQTKSVLTVEKGTPNPNGSLDEVYLLKGDNLDGEVVIDDKNSILPKEQADRDDTLYIYHVNDMHGNIMTYNAKGDTHNLAQMKQIVDETKESVNEDSSVLWVSAGDDHIGSKLDELMGQEGENFVMSPTYEAYSEAGVDFVCLGNHEFDKYAPTLEKMVQENADFPVIASNIFGSKYDLGTSVAAIGVVDGLRVGVIGLTVPEETNLKTELDPDAYAVDPMEALEKLVPALDDHCDFILVLSHNGYETSDRYTIEKGDGAVAEKVAELTDLPAVVVGGHTHTVLNQDGLESQNVYDGVPVVQAGQYGNYLGKVYADLGGEEPVYNARLLSIISGKETTDGTPYETEADYDKEFQTNVIDPMTEAVEGIMSKTIGKTDDTQELLPEVNYVDRYVGESAMANFYNDAIVARSENFSTGKVDFALLNATGIAGFPTNKEITFADLYAAFPYADTLYVVEMTGQDIKDIVENNAPRVVAAEDLKVNGGELDETGFIERGYLNFSSGIRYEIKDGQAVNITLNGENIENVLDKTYKMAVCTYSVIGRGGWQDTAVGQGLPEDFIGYDLKTLCSENGHDLGLLYRTEIVNYIMEDCNGLIGASTGVKKDGRVTIVE